MKRFKGKNKNILFYKSQYQKGFQAIKPIENKNFFKKYLVK
jgi:hypothetical protein